jgi:phosphoglycerol transferase MdoB-like AlkP superfamily enzyme
MKITNTFSRIVLLFLITFFALRGWEWCSYGSKYGFSKELQMGEIAGFFNDFLILSVFLAISFGLNFLLKKIKINILPYLALPFLLIFTFAHLGLLHYFNYQQTLLDVFVYQYPWKEVKHTMATTETNYQATFLGVALIFSLILGLNYFLKSKNLHERFSKSIKWVLILAIPLFLVTNYFWDWNNFAKNKSYHFYAKSIAYFLNLGAENQPFTTEDTKIFQSSYENRQFLSDEFPLLHHFENTDSLSSYLSPMSSPPNVVVLIMEGLNDDYIHDYRGLKLMPFLSDLAQKSLYWEQCFTLGERSFAAVPCITGGLPYGKKGFNFLEKLPSHHSLTSVLDANGYLTCFFDGQGSWFHNKDRFFKHNNLDLLFDNSKYDEKYEKIIVKDFFWGYNDKDMFRQSLEVIDTLPKGKRLDMYFSGTMHSPFELAEKPLYEDRFQRLIADSRNETEKLFFQKNAIFYKSILFTDDALADFFQKWKEKPNYENTIFIITGDHPMTELPRENSLKRYHVPLIIFSPKIKNLRIFSNRVSHLDIYETLVAFLDHQGAIKAPKMSASLGQNLFYKSEKPRPFAFMNDNREIIDFLYGDNYLSESQLYKVGQKITLTETNDRVVKRQLQEKLTNFKKVNYHVCTNDKIIGDSLAMYDLGFSPIRLNLLVKKVDFEAEYENIVMKNAVPSKEGLLDLSFETNFLPDDECMVVCEIKDKSDKEVYWKSEKLKNNTSFSHLHFKIPARKEEGSISIFFWNTKKQKVNINRLSGKMFFK